MTTPNGRSASRLASYLGRFNPVPTFPDYTGPYAVGSVDVEVPVGPGAPGPPEAQAAGISTVQFRVFYPADAASAVAAAPRVRWLPAPQRQYVAAYAQFLGARARVADAVSYLGRHLHYVALPVGEGAKLRDKVGEGPSRSGEADPARDEDSDAAAAAAARWPTLVFSHGLGGSRNAYAHLAASVASHGVVVVCPEHRDGSAVVSFMAGGSTGTTTIPFQRIPHTETADAWAARDAQLRIRLWELERVHAALLRLDAGTLSQDLLLSSADNNDTPAAASAAATTAVALDQFAGRLDVHRPGAIAWAGHSFGGASIVQLLKSVYYDEAVLYAPPPRSPLRTQITAASPTVLLDVWCFPLRSPTTRALYERPLPAWQVADEPGRPLLAVGSEAFYRWTVHLHETARVLSPAPSSSSPSSLPPPPPAVFYVARSAHLSQSDFGLVFPWLTRAVFKAPAPERALRLNVRAILQHLRRNGVAVARTSAEELVENRAQDGDDDDVHGRAAGTDDDTAILAPDGGGVVDWVWMDVAALAKEEGVSEDKVVEGVQTGGDGDDSDALEKAKLATADKAATEASMQSEIEQHIAA